MSIHSLELKNFKLHLDTKCEFSERLNFIIGKNGQGKTSLLEAIYYLCTSKSFNHNKDSESVNFDKDFFLIKGIFNDRIKNEVVIEYNKLNNKKNLFLDNKQLSKSSELIGNFPIVTLTQADLEITKGAPSARRKFIDSIISQASNTYLKIYLEFNKILKNRSSLLLKIKENYSESLINELEAWNISLVNTGSEIIKHRLNFIEEFNQYVKEAFTKIMNDKEVPGIYYSSFYNLDKSDINGSFFNELNRIKKNELLRAKNLVGPHRDDFIFSINNFDLKKFGSQGQHKTFQIALRFAQFFYLKDKLGKTPIFLMDDIFGEIDSTRAKQISVFLNEIGQSFITMTDFNNYKSLVKENIDLVMEVENGRVKYI